MLKKGVNISSHKAEKITFDDIQESSVILTLTRKQAEDVLKNVLNYYPSYQTKIIPMLDYLGIKDWEFPKLIGATQFVYSEFVGKMESVLPLFKIKFKQDTYLPLLVKGKGLGVGIIKGPVRIIESDVQVGEIEQGDVVVCSTNDVAGLLGRAVSEVGAIITESWSELGELSQTSYKFNIPCISSTSHPADVLQNGELVLLDAITGSVYGYPSANMPIKTDNLPGQEPKLSLADILKKYNIKPKES
jgi:phosphohistidine swiveling domain-containing protein